MTNEEILERLLRGDKAFFKCSLIVNVFDGSKITSRDSNPIAITVIDSNMELEVRWSNIVNLHKEEITFHQPSTPRTIKNGLRKRDIITKLETQYSVIGTCGSAVILSEPDNFLSVGNIYTLFELIASNYKLQQPEPITKPKKMTVAEISKLVGTTVEIIE